MTIEEFEDRRYLEQVARHLLHRYKMLIKWRDVDGMTYKEIAEAHNKKYGMYLTYSAEDVKRRYHTTIRRLKISADREALLCAEKCHI